jgi:CheY-like chemotaxis protein
MLEKPLILCVDDSPSVLKGRKMLLEENGYRVLASANGKAALQAFISNSVDLVLLDYHMPGINGDAVASRMRSVKPDVPIALLSSDEFLPHAVLREVDHFISKSEPIASFLEKIDHLLCLHFLFQPLDDLMTQNGVADGTTDD